MIINSSPLIIFSKLNRLDLLKKVFNDIIISEGVYKEVVENGLKLNMSDAGLVKHFVEKNLFTVKRLEEKWKNKVEFLVKIYTQLDIGEAETIALALQEKEKILLIDEIAAREVAKLYGLKPYGSLKVLLLAYKNKLLTEKDIKFLLTEMSTHKFRVSAEIINKFWMLFDKLKK